MSFLRLFPIWGTIETLSMKKESFMEQIWLEVSIDTTAAGIEPVCAYLRWA